MTYTQRATQVLLVVLIGAAAVLHGCRGGSPVGATGDTAAGDQDIVRELNAVRTNPKAYARLIESLRPYYNGKRFQEPGQPAILTQEGVAALDEAVRYLRSIPAAEPLAYSSGLSRAARDHVRDTGPKGVVSHTGSDGSTPRSRVERYGEWLKTMGENIAYSPQLSARRIVIQLLVDDGVADRGHRHAIVNPDYRLVGVATGTHAVYGFMCVQEFAGGFREFTGRAALHR